MSDILPISKSAPGQQREHPAKIIGLFLAYNRRSTALTKSYLMTLAPRNDPSMAILANFSTSALDRNGNRWATASYAIP